MPSGRYINVTERNQIADNMNLGYNVDEIYSSIFNNDPNKVSRSHLKRVCSEIHNLDHLQLTKYRRGPAVWDKTGRQRLVMNPQYLLNFVSEQNSIRIPVLTRRYNALYPTTIANPYRPIGIDTAYRTLHRFKYSRHCPEIRNMRASAHDQLQHLKAFAIFPVSRITAFDGMDNGPHKFDNNRCWGPVGLVAHREQYAIGSRFFSILATYGVNGFSNWSIMESTTRSDHVVWFMNTIVSRNKNHDDILMYDNAKVNVTQASLYAIDNVFNGWHKRLPVYSPQYNPIELGFSNIREYVHAHNHAFRAISDPIGLLNEAFTRYSENDHRGRLAAYGNWMIYHNNRARYLRFGAI